MEYEVTAGGMMPFPRDRLQAEKLAHFLVWFVNADLDRLPATGRQAGSQDALDCVPPASLQEASALLNLYLHGVPWRGHSLKDMRRLQRAALRGLQAYFSTKEGWTYQLTVKGAVQWSPTLPFNEDGWGREDHLFAWRTRQLVLSLGSRLRPCANPTCKRPFLAIRRQQFCTRRCNDQVRFAKFQARHAKDNKWREKQLEKRRAAYALKVRDKVGPNVKVGRQKKG